MLLVDAHDVGVVLSLALFFGTGFGLLPQASSSSGVLTTLVGIGSLDLVLHAGFGLLAPGVLPEFCDEFDEDGFDVLCTGACIEPSRP